MIEFPKLISLETMQGLIKTCGAHCIIDPENSSCINGLSEKEVKSYKDEFGNDQELPEIVKDFTECIFYYDIAYCHGSHSWYVRDFMHNHLDLFHKDFFNSEQIDLIARYCATKFKNPHEWYLFFKELSELKQDDQEINKFIANIHNEYIKNLKDSANA